MVGHFESVWRSKWSLQIGPKVWKKKKSKTKQRKQNLFYSYIDTIRRLPIPDPCQKTTPLYIIPQRCIDIFSKGHWRLSTLACSHLCSPELTWGPLWSTKAYLCSPILTFCWSVTYLFTIILFHYLLQHYLLHISTIFCIRIYIPPPLQRSHSFLFGSLLGQCPYHILHFSYM